MISELRSLACFLNGLFHESGLRGTLDVMPTIHIFASLTEYLSARYICASLVKSFISFDFREWKNPYLWCGHVGGVNFSFKRYKRNKMALGILRQQVVCGPIVFSRNAFHLYGNRITCFANNDNVYTFFITEREICCQPAAMKARQYVKLRCEICIISGHTFLCQRFNLFILLR